MPLPEWASSYLADYPDIAYQALRPTTGSWNYQQYWNQRQDRVRNQYLGTQAQSIMRGEYPTQSYVDYLLGFPFLRNWSQLSPMERGVRVGQYAPNLRWAV